MNFHKLRKFDFQTFINFQSQGKCKNNTSWRCSNHSPNHSYSFGIGEVLLTVKTLFILLMVFASSMHFLFWTVWSLVSKFFLFWGYPIKLVHCACHPPKSASKHIGFFCMYGLTWILLKQKNVRNHWLQLSGLTDNIY